MDIETWSKKAKIAGLVILTVSSLVVAGTVDPLAGVIAMTVTGCVYLVVQGKIDEKEQK